MSTNFLDENTRLENYLCKFAESISIDFSKERLTEIEASNLIKLILVEYVKGKVSVDDLSMFCEMIYGKLDPESDLFSLLLMGAEIEWYIRHEPQTAADAITDLLERFVGDPIKEENVNLGMKKIKRLLEKYYLWADADTNQEKLSLEEGEKIGVCLTEDYFNGKVSIDELALLCGQIYEKLDKNYSLYKLFEEGHEISLNIRKKPAKAAKTIENLFKYFDIKTNS